MAGVDAVIGKGYVDTTRMYVSGCSGGGVLSSWVIGHTGRFAAAAVRCPVIDWISMAGQTDIPLFTYSFFHQAFWDKPDEWLAHSSLMQVGHVTTPTLLMTGEVDRRTPIPPTEEFYAALQVRGVPTVMLRCTDELLGLAPVDDRQEVDFVLEHLGQGVIEQLVGIADGRRPVAHLQHRGLHDVLHPQQVQRVSAVLARQVIPAARDLLGEDRALH